VDEWTSILDLSARWAFKSIQSLAIERLTLLASPVDKLILGRKFHITKWLRDAYRDVCEREQTLTLEEGLRLGISEVIKISHARQVIRQGAMLVAPSRVHFVVDETFGLGVPKVPGASREETNETDFDEQYYARPNREIYEEATANFEDTEVLQPISPPPCDRLLDIPAPAGIFDIFAPRETHLANSCISQLPPSVADDPEIDLIVGSVSPSDDLLTPSVNLQSEIPVPSNLLGKKLSKVQQRKLKKSDYHSSYTHG